MFVLHVKDVQIQFTSKACSVRKKIYIHFYKYSDKKTDKIIKKELNTVMKLMSLRG